MGGWRFNRCKEEKKEVILKYIGGESGIDSCWKSSGARRGAVCHVKSRKRIVAANDDNFSPVRLAA